MIFEVPAIVIENRGKNQTCKQSPVVLKNNLYYLSVISFDILLLFTRKTCP